MSFRSLYLLPFCSSLPCYHLLLLLLGLGLAPVGAIAQQPPAAADDSSVENIWAVVESQLATQASDTSLFFIKLLVRGQCGQDYACLKDNYESIMIKLEKRFDLLESIYIGEELARLARTAGDLRTEAKIFRDLARYYDAIGNAPLRTEYLRRALTQSRELGDWDNYLIARTGEIIWTYTEDLATCYLMLEILLEEALLLVGEGGKSIPKIAVRLAISALGMQCYEQAHQYISLLEKVPVSPPYEREEYGVLVNYHYFKALIAFQQNQYQEARVLFDKARYWCAREPSRWVEVATMNKQAALDHLLDKPRLARARLDTAEIRARALDAYDLIAGVYDTRAQIAEASGDYEAALINTRESNHYQAIYEEKKAGFDVKNYYLMQEQERIEAEKARQEWELALRTNQLRSTVLSSVLLLLLLVGMGVAVIKLRNRKEALARQNQLIQEQAERLRSLDLAKSRFFANVSHELRTPLTLILGPVRTLLKEQQKTAKQAGLLQVILKSGEQLGQLVAEILDLGKLEMGKMILEEKPTQVSPFFERGIAQFESLAERKGIRMRTYLSPSPDKVLYLDTKRVQRILNNLLSNAFKFTPTGGQIEVRLVLDAGLLHLYVRDNGVGIHPDDIPHLFERYFQALQPDKPAEGGTGIGLALCYEYVRLMGGDIEVESKWREGTTFHVYVPVREADPSEEPAVSKMEVHRDLSTREHLTQAGLATPARAGASLRHVLVVEDHPSLQEYLSLLLSPHYAVATVDHGKAALDYLISGQACDLVITDLMMPIMDGHALLQELRNRTDFSHLPVMMLTARTDIRDRIKALRIGVDDYLIKPFEEEELIARLQNLIENRSRRNVAEPTLATKGPPAAHLAQQTPKGLHVPEPFTEEDQEWLQRFEAHLLQHIADPIYNVPAMAQAFAMSESTLRRTLKRMTGLTPNQYLQTVRLTHARYLLESTEVLSIQQLAQEVGYRDAKTFSRSFKRRFGRQPSSYLE